MAKKLGQFDQWLKNGGYDRAWYDSLPAWAQTKVDGLYKKMPDPGKIQSDPRIYGGGEGLNGIDAQAYGNVPYADRKAMAKKGQTAPSPAAAPLAPAQQKKAPPTSGITDEALRAAGIPELQITQLRGQTDAVRNLALTGAQQGQQQTLLGLNSAEANMTVFTNRAGAPYTGNNPAIRRLASANSDPDTRDSIGNVLNGPNGSDWDVQRIQMLQKRLVDARYLKVGDYAAGDYDTATLNAYHQAILDAVRKGRTADEQIQDRADAFSGSNDAFNFVAPPKQLADPNSVQAIVTKIYNTATGHDPSPADLKKLIGVYRAQEEQIYQNSITAAKYQQQTQYAQQAGGSLPTVPTISGPQSESDIEADLLSNINDSTAPADTFAHSMGQQLQTFAQIIKGS